MSTFTCEPPACRLVQTEEGYVKDLRTLMKKYIRPAKDMAMLSDQDKKEITANAEGLLNCNEELLKELLASSLMLGAASTKNPGSSAVAAIAGTVGPLGFLSLQLSNAAGKLPSISDGAGLQTLVVVLLTAVFAASSVSGIQKCGSESRPTHFSASSVANSSQSAAMSAADIEKEPSEVPTCLTSGGRYCTATSYVTFSSCIASPLESVAISPYWCSSSASHCSLVGIGRSAARMSAG